MALSGAVSLRQFEIIRTRLAQILTIELPSQAALQARQDINAEVYTSRLPPFDHTDLPCVNVKFAKGDFPSKYANKADSTHMYHIDIFTKKPSTDGMEGGEASSEVGERIAGTIQGILDDPSYKLLEFSAPSLRHTEVTSIITPEYLTEEATNYRLHRVIFQVDTIEGVQFDTPAAFGSAITNVTVNCTDKGYRYEIPLDS